MATAIVARGHVAALASDAEDLLLGVDCTVPRHEGTIALEPGSTVLLYTDGLIERRGVPIDDSIAHLMEVFGSVHQVPLEELCNQVLDQLLTADNEDDVALLAVRVLDA